MTAEVIRWRGGPGAGKTWQLLEDVRREVEDGRTFRDLCLMTFSRSQADDLAARLHQTVLPDVPVSAIRQRCATIDAIALRACRDAGLIVSPKEQVIQPGDPKKAGYYTAFMEAHSLAYDQGIGTGDREDLSRENLPFGNQLIAIAGYLTATMQDPEAWKTAAGALGLPTPGYAWPVPDLLRAWADYKARQDIYEHGDYVALALREHLPPPAPVVFVDEYQDVSPLHDALIRQWIEHPDAVRVYVAGDADQSIYGFRGCSPDLFLSLPAEDRGARDGSNRPVSHRCPVRIMEVAERILRHPANVAPSPRAGQVGIFRPQNIATVAEQIEGAIQAYPGRPVFLLSRFKRHTRLLARQVTAAGIPCSGIRDPKINRLWGKVKIGRTSTSREAATVDLWTLTKGVRRCVAGSDIDPVPLDEAEALITAAVPAPRREHALVDIRSKSKRAPVRLGDVFKWTGDGRIFNALNLRPALLEQMRICIDREARRGFVIAPDLVKIDTIHSAKGLEAAVVLLHTGYLDGMIDGLVIPERQAEERRIYFVGATRAERALVLMDYGGPVCPLLQGVIA